MQCNSINVMEEPVIITRNSHPTELDLSRGPQQPNGEKTPSWVPWWAHTYKHRPGKYESRRHAPSCQMGGGWVRQPSGQSSIIRTNLEDG
jgi:hypothetical protein